MNLSAPTRPWASDTVQQRIAEVSSALPIGDPQALSDLLVDTTRATRETFDRSFSLYAGANVLSALAARTASVGLGSRPTLGDPGEKFPSGVDQLDVIELAATEAVRNTMGAAFADVRPTSATIANLAVLCAFTTPGDTIAALPEPAGGHISHHSGAPWVRGLTVASLPYDYSSFDVDYDALPEFLKRVRPTLIIVGGNLMLRPLDLHRLVPLVAQAGIPILYDASHVAGLIAGGQFQDPLGDGVDVLTFSTYKSFGGPAGGAVCTNDAAVAARVAQMVYPILSANYDVHRLAPLAVVASVLATEGREYARSCIANAREMGRALVSCGVPVLGESFGYTDSHHLAVDVSDFGGGAAGARLLAEAGIFLSPTLLPLGDDETAERGLRVGTQELTARGYGADTARELAFVMADVIRGECGATAARARLDALRGPGSTDEIT
jgi:glycine hydroxymethyltransferase